MTTPLSSLETDLNTLATLDPTNPETSPAQATSALTAAQDVLSLLADQALVGPSIGGAVSGVYTTIANTISDDVVKTLQAIATELTSPQLNLNVSDAASALNALQNALQTAQSLVPGGSSAAASALASTSQFATLFGNLLTAESTVGDAAKKLQDIAQQLAAIATAFTTAAEGKL
jgi:hypothetical protein